MTSSDAESQDPHAPPLRIGAAGRFVLQPGEHRLLVDGQAAALGRRALDLLIALTSRPDHLFSKHELLDRVWPGLVVEEANLQMQIANLRKVLGGDAIATVPGRGYRFVAPIVQGAVTPRSLEPMVNAVTPGAQAAVPRRDGLFGRDADLEQLEGLLQPGACVTVVGPAGVGKTSLARALAERTEGNVWVDLAPLSRGDEVAGAVARALGVSLSDGDAAPQLLRALHGKVLLLVLDNAEHLIHPCAELATLLRPLADMRLLVTSQLPLAVAGERVHRLQPLALPGEDGDGGLADGALALLVERITAANHRFIAAAALLPVLRSICAQLDGLPLALEMAAARVPLLGLQGVHDALAQRFALLTRGHRDSALRHRTLQHALDWSYQLLGAPEQRLFRALGVFAGGFTLELAVALMTDDAKARWDIVDELGTLADRSLMVVGNEDPPRYRLLETMRAFAIEQLRLAAAPADEENTLRRRHAGALFALFARFQPDDHATQALCEAEMENVREAIAWAQAHDLALAAQLTALVTPVTHFSVWRQESTRWLRALEAAMEQPTGLALRATVQAAWWTEFARTSSIRRDPRAAAAARRALALWDAAGDPRQALFAACVNVRSHYAPGADLDRACEELDARSAALPGQTLREQLQVRSALVTAATERADHQAILSGRLAEMALAGQLGLQARVDAAESNVVFVLNAMDRYVEAAQRGRALLERIDAGGGSSKGNLPWVLQGLLRALMMKGGLEEAQALVPRAWAACAHFGVPVTAPTVALLAAMRGRFDTAALLIGYASEAFVSREMTMGDVDQETVVQVQSLTADALGAARAQALVARGRALDEAAAAALAAGDESVTRGV